MELFDKSFDLKRIKNLLPKRASDSHKGDFGRVFLIGGSRGMTGSVCLSAMAAQRSGAGLVTVGLPKKLQPIAAVKLTEAMTLGFSEHRDSFSGKDSRKIIDRINLSDVCAIGMGLSENRGAKAMVFDVIKGAEKPLVIDADALNAVSGNTGILKSLKTEAVLTPHPGEMARLTGKSVYEVQSERLGIASRYAKEFNSVLVLKGEKTVVASPRGEVYINPTGNCGMATGGSGDVLSGIVASFIGQGLSTFDAAVLSVYLHGRAGDIAAKKLTPYSLIASDIIGALPDAFGEII